MLIGEVSRRSGVSARMLRHYNGIGLVVPSGRTSGGYREYSEEDMRRLFAVESLRSLGLPLSEVARALDEPGFEPSALVVRLIATTRERLVREQELLTRLERVRDGGPAVWADVLDLIGLMRGLESAHPEERQRTALRAEGRARIPASALVDAVLAERDPNVAGALQWALARAGDEAVPALTAALTSPHVERRRRAASTLAEIGGAVALASLAGALADQDAVVRGRAAVAVGRGGSPDAVPELIRMIVDGRDDVEAAEVLGELGRRHGSAEALAARIREELGRPDAPSEARVRLVQALADVPGPIARHTLSELAADGDARVAMIAGFLLR